MIEYSLTGNEFKLLHLLRNTEIIMTQREIANIFNVNQRSVRDNIKTLLEYNIIRVEKVKSKNKYYVNNTDKWNLNAYTHKQWKKELNILCLEEKLNNENNKESRVIN